MIGPGTADIEGPTVKRRLHRVGRCSGCFEVLGCRNWRRNVAQSLKRSGPSGILKFSTLSPGCCKMYVVCLRLLFLYFFVTLRRVPVQYAYFVQ